MLYDSELGFFTFEDPVVTGSYRKLCSTVDCTENGSVIDSEKTVQPVLTIMIISIKLEKKFKRDYVFKIGE